jgi:redox-sensitive bicupin YhaK (pirin superfamily)
MFTDSFGAEVLLRAGTSIEIPIDKAHEAGVLVVEGSATVNGTGTATTELAFAEAGGGGVIRIESATGARAVLLGGTPFTERLVMWWNFVERSHTEIRDAREQWEAGDPRFGEFSDHIGGRIPAPELPNVTLQPRV